MIGARQPSGLDCLSLLTADYPTNREDLNTTRAETEEVIGNCGQMSAKNQEERVGALKLKLRKNQGDKLIMLQ